jgi:ferritin-like metal-binding protein YciE
MAVGLGSTRKPRCVALASFAGTRLADAARYQDTDVPIEDEPTQPEKRRVAPPQASARRRPRSAAVNALDKELREARDGERRLAAFLPRAASAVQLSELRTLLRGWTARALRSGRTLQGLRRARGFDAGGERAGLAIGGLVAEARGTLRGAASLARDLRLITHLRRVLHVQLAASRSLWAWSARVGDVESAQLFEELARDYREVDRSLERLGESVWRHRVEETDGMPPPD